MPIEEEEEEEEEKEEEEDEEEEEEEEGGGGGGGGGGGEDQEEEEELEEENDDDDYDDDDDDVLHLDAISLALCESCVKVHCLLQGCTNPGRSFALETQFCSLAFYICGTSVWNVFRATLLAPKILSWLLGFLFCFWKTFNCGLSYEYVTIDLKFETFVFYPRGIVI